MIGVIPARGGSKGIPHKNIKLIAGKPLITWTIESSLNSKLLKKFIITTDDKTIKAISLSYGVEVIYRPKELATDNSPIIKTLQHTLKQISCSEIVLLQPTSPIRNKELIDNCIRKYKRYNKKYDNLATGFECKYKPYGTQPKNRQDIKGFFYDDGNVYIINSKLIKQGKTRSKNYLPYYTTREENIEIDDIFDFWLVEQILLKK